MYIGSTNKLKRRLDGHNQGKCQATKPYTPLILIAYVAVNTDLSGSRLRKMDFYTKITRDTSIKTVSIPKYHPLFSFSPIKGEKVLPGSHISDSYCRPWLPALILQELVSKTV
ncbi:MAG: GIY-YIG nuclease family protein [Candidatus Marinimicrobia bacterium]|nr:GIY-YIG nuclease family protein [Candidatus Neomarinimicrobiota bacterium]MBL7046235.1 GIY-YIG nuclease family protein [Candidatus Neomarinimicrobiota bacterium]